MPDARDAYRPSNAHENGVRTLYKFMRYPPDGEAPELNQKRRSWVEALLRDGDAYFPTGAELNDPFEASPLFRSREAPPEELFDLYSRALRGIHAPEMGWDAPTVEEMERSLQERIRTGELGALADITEMKYRSAFRQNFPMLCLSATRDSVPMWSYYADDHTGLCVHFDADRVPIGNALKVNYAEAYPTILLPIADMPGDLVASLALGTKSCAWKHEEEYRLINFPRGAPYTGGRVFDGVFGWKSPQLAVMPKTHIFGVTLGASMGDQQIEDLLRICHDRRPRIPVVQRASLQRDRFALRFARVS